MSSKTKAQFILECQSRSAILDDTVTFENTVLELYIDIALRAYSKRQAELRVKSDNAVVEGQIGYDKPANALNIISLWTHEEHLPIAFTVVTDSETAIEKIYPGSINQHSTDGLMEQSYYNDSLNSYLGVSAGYSCFDIEFTVLHTMSSIKETGLEALYWYMEYLGYSKKAGKTALQAEDESAQSIDHITDRDGTGASTTTSFSSKLNVSSNYIKLAQAALKQFESETSVPYGTRG
jgi:hypothetical protein